MVQAATEPVREPDRGLAAGRARRRGRPGRGEACASSKGIASSLGLFHTTLLSGGNRILVPNNTVIQIAIVPIREPERVDGNEQPA